MAQLDFVRMGQEKLFSSYFVVMEYQKNASFVHHCTKTYIMCFYGCAIS